ncbi:AsmA family protein [Pararhizobium haloflavum]|uniref:AsmA family protein n=1 Tax=Pararhizobium haloflavum TaxID=2037914 RepID=UPI000C1A806E|nr:AsmA-like C-terminal region-containing protein [Pararhizobium haloflavum]
MAAAESKRDDGAPSRWLLSAIALVVLLSVVIVVAVPLLISKDALRERLEQDVGAVTGHRVTIGEAVEIAFLPIPTVIARDLEVRSSTASADETLLAAGEVRADFAIMSALTGRPQFSNVALIAPELAITIRADGTNNWRPSDRQTPTENPATQNVAPMQTGPMAPLGIVRIENGVVRIRDERRGREETLTSVNGTLSWPRVGLGARVELAAVLRDEPVRLVASAERPADLLAGDVAPLRLTFTSDLLNLSYNGTASLRAVPVLDGEITLASPSVRRALRWSGTEIKPGEAIGALELEAEVQTALPQVRLEDLIIDIDDNRGIGALDISWQDAERPTVAGTLAYDTLDVGAFLRAFTPLPSDGDAIASTIDTGFLRQLGMDLRLSAQTARVGTLTLGNLAAAARIEEGRALFDIGDATAYGGNVLGRIAISEDGFDGGGELQFSAQGVDFGAVYDAIGIRGPLPRGVGMMNMSIVSPNPIWATALQDLRGSIEMTMQNGAVPMLNLARFRELSSNQRFFEIDQAAEGQLGFTSASFVADFANGTAEIKTGEITTGNARIVLSGLIPYDRGSLAMSGAILAPSAPLAPGQDANSVLQGEGQPPASPSSTPPLRFFIGGSWPNPVISPIFQN